MPHIRLEHVTKRFGDFVAVDNLDLEIQDREFVSLLGPSGCGKTTTLRMIAGLETPTQGDIWIGDRLVFSQEKGVNLSPDKRDVGFLFQNYALWPHMTVYKNIAFGLENLKWKKSDIKARVEELLTMLRIEEFVGRYPAELSGGQQQRVAIARTLATNPHTLLMDEPLSNLDAKLRNDMRAELKRLHLKTDATFVYVTHDQSEAMTLSTNVCVMKNGLLQQYCPPLEMYAAPANLFVADFVGNPSMNLIPCKGRVQDGAVVLEALGQTLRFIPGAGQQLPQQDALVLGVRPENVEIVPAGIPATISSSLPTGMETMIVLSAHERFVSAVAFGSVDYKMDSAVHFAFRGSDCLLYDEGDGQLLCRGSVQIV